MSSLAHTTDDPSDAAMIDAARSGDLDAFGVLYGRHLSAAQRLARQLAHSQAEADDLVSEAFAKVLDSLQAGGGPDTAFRAYLLTTLRNLRYDRLRRDRRLEYSGDLTDLDPGVPFVDTALQELENTMVAKAFRSLPERWRTVLWHTEVEGESPAQVAPMLGLTPNGVSALAYRAREGLRQAYLQVHLQDAPGESCRSTVERLGAWARQGLCRRDKLQVEAHLAGCARCRQLGEEVADINHGLLGVVAVLVVGAPWVGGYLAHALAAQAAGTAAGSALGGAVAAAAAHAGPAAAAHASSAAAHGAAAAHAGAATAAHAGAATAAFGQAAAGIGSSTGLAAGASLGTAGATAGAASAGLASSLATAGGTPDPSGLGVAAGATGTAVGAAAAAKFGLVASLLQLPGMAKLGAGVGTAVVAGGLVISMSHAPARPLVSVAPPPIVAPNLAGPTSDLPTATSTPSPSGPTGGHSTGGGRQLPKAPPAKPAGSTGSTPAPPAGRPTGRPADPGAPPPGTGRGAPGGPSGDETKAAASPLAVQEATPGKKNLVRGKPGKISIQVKNVSDNQVTNLVASISLPQGVTLRGADSTTDNGAGKAKNHWDCSPTAGGTTECQLPSLEPGATTIDLKVTVADDAPPSGTLTGQIIVDTTDQDDVPTAIPDTPMQVDAS
jgi:RNA polymerase sigma factor (sigma-70 family)